MSTEHVVHQILVPGLDGDGFTSPEAAIVRNDIASHATAIERVDPGTSGDVGQSLTVGPLGPVWLDEPVFNVKHPRFGANGNTPFNTSGPDDTAAIQAAINAAEAAGGGVVLFPKGSYRIDGALTINSRSITLRGSGKFATYLWKMSAGNLFTLSGANNLIVEHMRMATGPSAGHIFETLTSCYMARWSDLHLKQYATGKSIFAMDDTISGRPQADYVDNLWYRVETVHELTATVPSIQIRSYAANRNRWIDCRPTNSGNYHYWIETTHASGARAIGNVFEGITGEILNGGAIKILGGMGTRITDFDMWDFSSTISNHLIVLDQSDTNGTKYTTHTILENVRRVSGTLGSGIHDLYIGDGDGGGNNKTTLITCGGYVPLQVRNRGSIEQIGGDVSYSSTGAITRMAASGSGSYFGTPVRLASYTTAQRPAANSVAAGSMIYDSTLGKPIWSNNVNWRDAAGTIV